MPEAFENLSPSTLSLAALGRLRNWLADLVPELREIELIISDSGLRHARIDHTGSPQQIWGAVLDEAMKQGDSYVDAVLTTVRALYPGRAEELARLSGRLPSESRHIGSVPFPVPIAIASLPARNPYFAGRERELNAVHEALTRAGGRAALTQATAISGLGGIGKSQTAVEYAWRHKADYDYLFFVRAIGPSELEAGFQEIARALDLPEKDAREREVAANAVKLWLEGHARWLLILDNADDLRSIKRWLPGGTSGHVLLTTRARALYGMAKAVPLDELPAKEAVALLQKRTERGKLDKTERKAAQALAEALGGLPLALEQAGAYIAEKQVLFVDYLKSYEHCRLDLLEKGRPMTGDYPETVATTWSLNMRAVAAESAAAVEVLRLSAFLDWHSIPLELLTDGWAALGEEVAKALSGVEDTPVRVDEVLEPLARYSLIRRDVEGRTYRVHRLLQEVVRSGLREADQHLRVERLVGGLNTVFPHVEFRSWSRCERLIEHVKALGRWIELYGLEDTVAARLLNEGGYYLYQRAEYLEAEPLFCISLGILEKALEPEHPHIARSLNNLAMLLDAQGRYTDAEPMYRQSLRILEKTLGPDHPDVGRSLANLAKLLSSQRRYAEAEPMYHQSLRILEKELGSEHVAFAECLNNLAMLLDSQGRSAEAEPLYDRSLAIREKFGPDHPAVAESLISQAKLLSSQGRYAEAEPLHRRSLEILEKALGPDHPDVAAGLNDLALLLKSQGQNADADPLLERAIRILERATPEHPNLAIMLRYHAAVLSALDRAADAEALEVRASAHLAARAGSEQPADNEQG